MGFLFLGIILFVLAGYAIWNRRPYAERMNLLRRAVRISAGDMRNAYPGQIVAISGTARNEQPMVSEQTQTPCVYYDYEVVHRYKKRRGLPLGNNRDRDRYRHSRHETVAEDTQWTPFLVEDDTGQARVVPNGAEFEPQKSLDHFEPESGNNPFGIPWLNIDSGFGWGKQTIGYRIRENLIPADARVFVAGTVDDRGQITRSNGNHMIVTHRDESTLREEWGNKEKWQLYGALGSAGLGMLVLFVGGVQWVISSIV